VDHASHARQETSSAGHSQKNLPSTWKWTVLG
jgi:hypothetical protein